MPPRKPSPSATRCVYREGKARCSKPGTGNPYLCQAHRIVLEGAATTGGTKWGDGLRSILDNFQAGKKLRSEDLRRGVSDVVGAIFGDEEIPPIDELVREAAERAQRAGVGASGPAAAAQRARWQQAAEQVRQAARARAAQAAGRPPPPRQAPPQRGPDPREALGFTSREVLTREMVQKRRRELARKHHPDRGGSKDRMAAINHAADQLLAGLR